MREAVPNQRRGRKYPVEKLNEELQELERGQTIPFRRVCEACGFADPGDTPDDMREKAMKRMRHYVQAWLLKNKGFAIKQTRKGFYALTDEEQARRPAERTTSARRRVKLGLLEGGCVNPLALNKGDLSKLERTMEIAVRAAQHLEGAVSEIRYVLDGRRNPSRLDAKKRDDDDTN